MTFSRSVAEHIARVHQTPLQIVRLRLRLGRRVMPDDSSRSGLYAVVSVRTGTILRVTLFRALAHEWRDPSRDIYECYADAVDNASLIARSTTSPRSSARQSRESNDLDLKPGVVFITLPVMDTQYCPRCQETKPLTEFHWQKKGVRRQRYCKPCQRERMHAQYQKDPAKWVARSRERGKKIRQEYRELVIALKDQPCMDCGVPYPHWVMDLDHRDPTTKVDNVSTLVSSGEMSRTRFSEELAKCDVVCANCHREREHRRREHARSIRVAGSKGDTNAPA